MGLHSLETLFLSCEHLEALLPELRLQGLPKLRHIRLDDVFPAELSLPPGCRLDIKGEASVMDEVIYRGSFSVKHMDHIMRIHELSWGF